MALNETTFEDAIFRWVERAVSPVLATLLSFSADYPGVVWDRQKAPPPGTPYVTLRLAGPGASDFSEDQTVYDPAGPAGQEMEERTIHHDVYALRVQTYARTPAEARALAKSVRTAAHSDSRRAELRDSVPSIVVAEVGALQDVGTLLDTEWQGRYALDLTLRVADVDTERTTYIQTAPTTGSLT